MIFIFKLQPRDLSGKEKPLYGPLAQRVEKPQEKTDIEANIKEYESRTKKVSKQEVQRFLESADEWEKNNNVREIRRAGVSAKENEKDPLIKHAKLSAAYLTRVKGEERPTYKVDFKQNEMAEFKVGAGDILPPTVTIIEINGERGFRSVNPENGRIGYYNSEIYRDTGRYEYMPVFTDDTITIIKTESPESPIVKRREIAEHVTLYQRQGPEPIELSEMTPAERQAQEDLAKLERDSKARIEKVRARRGISGLREEMGEGREGVIVGSAELMKQRRRVVEIARRYVGRVVPEFRSKEVQGGKLACAKVATTILQEAGYLNKVELNVDDTKDVLIRKGWRASNEPAEPGDVIIWAPTRRKIRRTQGAMQIIPGHKHIGIALGPNWAVSNSSSRGMAREHIIYTGRRVEAILKPPGSRKGSGVESAKKTQEKAEKERKNFAGRSVEGFGVSESMNRAIERQVGKYDSIILRAAAKYRVDPDLIRAVIMQESGGRPALASHAGAGGLMQLMPAVARHAGITDVYPLVVKVNSKGKRYYRLDPRDGRNDPERNIMAGTALISSLLKMHKGNASLALASYNWGSGNVSKYRRGIKKRMPMETQNYISRNIKKGAIGKYLSLKAGKGEKPQYSIS